MLIKISRAKKHFQELDLKIREFLESEPYHVEIVSTADHAGALKIVNVVNEIPGEWACIVGDIAHNLRSSLDIKVADLIRKSGGKINWNTSFPIYAKKEDFINRANKKIAGLSQRYIKIIEDIKPYEEHPIVELSKLNNADKHSQLTITGCYLKSIAFLPPKFMLDNLPAGVEVPYVQIESKAPIEPIKKGALIPEWTVPTEDLNALLKFEIGYIKNEGEAYIALLPKLNELIEETQKILKLLE